MSTYRDWWSCLEERELNFITEDKPGIHQYLDYGLEHLSLHNLRHNGLTKVLKIRENIVELREPLNPRTICVDQISYVLGDKYKVPVVEATTQQEVGSKSMKEWRQYINMDPSDREQILNVMSLEFSHTKLAEYAFTPRAIREIDWINYVWPHSLRDKGEYPGVQQYLWMAAAGTYTNFHIDFGGSSVWYNVVKGEKIFILCPPTENNLKEFQKWHLDVDSNYFTDNIESAVMCVIEEGNSIVIPSGWIHAVYTPKDSVAFGGNFLHGYSFEMQLKIHGIEENLQDPLKYRFPFFEEMMWYVADHYIKKVKGPRGRNDISVWENRGLSELVDWLKYYKTKKPSAVRSAQYIYDALKSYLNDQEIPDVDHYAEEENTDEDSNTSYCICNGKSDDQLWIGCSSCGGWFHQGCVGLTPAEVEQIENYYCAKCSSYSEHTNMVTSTTTTASATSTTPTATNSGKGRESSSSTRSQGRGRGRGNSGNSGHEARKERAGTSTRPSAENSQRGNSASHNTAGHTATTNGRGGGRGNKTNTNGAVAKANHAGSSNSAGITANASPSGNNTTVRRKVSNNTVTNTSSTSQSSGAVLLQNLPSVAKRKVDPSFTQPKAKKVKST